MSDEGTGDGGPDEDGPAEDGDENLDGDSSVNGGATKRPHPLRNWRTPLLTALGMAVSVALVALVDPVPGPLVLVAVLSMTLSRNRLVTTWRGRAEAIIGLPIVGLATTGVAYLLLFVPIAGASAFVIAMFLSIWFRRFGPVWSRVGSLIALPFITLLIAPGGGGTTWWGAAILSVVALVVVVALRVLAEVTGFVPKAPTAAGHKAPAAAEHAVPRPSSLRPIPSTRMAIQMAIALAAAFVIGELVFPGHVTWVVLTAFLVCSGNRGRADVLYKSGLRIVGATAGTVAASIGLIWVTPSHPFLQGPWFVVLLLVIIAVGLWLREWTYAIWAFVMTLVITLLRGVAIPIAGGTTGDLLWERVIAIVIGAVLGLAASWFVLPVRSEGVVRRRVADSLAALSRFVDDRSTEHNDELSRALVGLDEVATPWNAWERVSFWRTTMRKPGQWMDLVHECVALARAAPRVSGAARRALGEARRSMRDPLAIGPALLALRDELSE